MHIWDTDTKNLFVVYLKFKFHQLPEFLFVKPGNANPTLCAWDTICLLLKAAWLGKESWLCLHSLGLSV